MAADTSTRRRVKLYMLNEERMWDDRGTGHVSSAFVDRLKGMSLQVRSENDGSLLLESKIMPDTAYQKQQETLIVWSEADNYDLALSFQEKAGCDEIWEKICQVQGKDPSVDITQDVVEESEDERFEELPDAAPPIELPPAELSKLDDIGELFSSVLRSPIRCEKLAIAVEKDSYIKKLLDLFHMCEDLENNEGLYLLYDIFKSLFLLNKNSLFEIMFSDECIFDVVGVLEYDRTLQALVKHREYLRTKAKFKEVVPLNNPDLVQKIHQTYRVQYIQDVILPTPSVFEENMLSTLTSFIFFNKVEIVSMIQEDEKFLKALFSELVGDETDDEKRVDLVLFLKDFCTFSQTLQPASRDSFFKTLSSMGVLGALEIILGLDDEQMKIASIDIFSYVVEYSPSMVREFVLLEGNKTDDEDLLINLAIEQMISDTDPELGGAVQLMGILRVLIDPENMLATANKTEKTEFLSFFYKHSMHILTAPLFAITTDTAGPSRDDYQTAQLLSLILELLTFCIEHHTYHIKNYVLSKDLLRRILVLLRSKHAFLALCALRLMRRMIGLKDDFYNRYIIKGDLFKPVVEAFKANGDKYNLLNSAMIEIFEFIAVEDIRLLIQYFVETHYKSFVNVDYVKTFRILKERYEQHQERLKDRPNIESMQNMQSILRNNRLRRDARAMEDDEAMWFEQDDEMEEEEEKMRLREGFDDDDTDEDMEEEEESLLPMTDSIKSKLDSDFDFQINKILENKKAKENDAKEENTGNGKFASNFCVQRGNSISITSPISISLKNTSPAVKDKDNDSKEDKDGRPKGSLGSAFNLQHGGAPLNSPVSISHKSSPPSCGPQPTPAPNSSPVNSPESRTAHQNKTPFSSPVTEDKNSKKAGLVGLVDYPDEDSEEEEQEEDDDSSVPANKRPRLST